MLTLSLRRTIGIFLFLGIVLDASNAFVLPGTTRTGLFSSQAAFLKNSLIKRAASEVDADTSEEKEAVETATPPLVQRQYETFHWKHEGNDYKINYRVEGPDDGPPLLLVHGFGANINHFRKNIPALAQEGYRVYAVDLLGFGASDKAKEEFYCIELFAQLLQEFIQAMNAKEPWIIGGNSIGGLCCLAVAQSIPHLIQGIVLFNCAGGMTGFRYEDVPLLIRPILYFIEKVVLGPFWGPRFFSGFKSRANIESILTKQGVYGDVINVDDELLEILLGPADDEGAEEVFLRVFGGPPGPTPESILPELECPILALWGGADPWCVILKAHRSSCFGR